MLTRQPRRLFTGEVSRSPNATLREDIAMIDGRGGGGW